MGTAQLRYGPVRCSSCKPARLPVPQQVVRLCRSADPHLSRITVLPPAYRLRDPGISRESELFALSSRRHILALVTNVPHYAEARRSRVPCQPKLSGCFQPIPGLIVPYPFGSNPFWSALGWCQPRAEAVKGQPPLRCRHTQLLSSFAKGAPQRLPS